MPMSEEVKKLLERSKPPENSRPLTREELYEKRVQWVMEHEKVSREQAEDIVNCLS